jgi:hypothetical protein
MEARRGFVGGMLSLLGSLGCSREKPMTKRAAKMGHEPWVLWPEGEPPAGGWPVLLFLHGQGESAWKEEGDAALEQGPNALVAHGSPVALYRAKDSRVKTLWQSFVLIAPQALNTDGVVRWWDWSEPAISQRVGSEVDSVLKTGKANAKRISATGFSRGGRGVYRLDSSSGPLQFRKLASVDAQGLDELAAAVKRGREVRAYYGPTTYDVIRDAHLAAEKVYGKATPPVSLIQRPQRGRDDEAHIGICTQVYAEDDLYAWLLA